MLDQIEVKKLEDRVEGCFIQNPRFKTTRISVSFCLPLNRETVSGYAMLPFLLSRSSREYPDSLHLNARLDTLYGASVSAESDKLGDLQVLRFGISFIENRYAPDGTDLAAECAKLLKGLIFEPACDNGGFLEANFAKEKRLFLERIDGEINDKRTYAKNRCEAVMCENEPYGISKYGAKQQAEGLTRDKEYEMWKSMLSNAFVRINVVSASHADSIFEQFTAAFGSIQRTPAEIPEPIVKKARSEVKTETEHMSISQGKLVMGFRTDKTGADESTAPMMVFSDLFGGGPYSRLFSNVREKLSLCYYCAARINRKKGILLVDSGVEFDNMEKAKTEILKQLEVMKNGEFTDEEFAASKMSLADSAKSVLDSSSATDRWYADRMFEKTAVSPERFGELITKVTKQQVVDVAIGITLDTVYMLKGQEDTKNG